jgi:ribose/xylose/arabinose/galactoside ABC-type transport system permease subunit
VIRLQINAFIVTLARPHRDPRPRLVPPAAARCYNLPADFRAVATTDLFGLPLLVLILVLAYVAFHVVLTRTQFGRYVYLVGGNRPRRSAPASTSGASSRVHHVRVLAAIRGVAARGAHQWCYAQPRAQHAVQAFAAVVIGGVSLRQGGPAVQRVRRACSALGDRHRDQRDGAQALYIR